MNDAVLDQSARVTRISAPIASPGCCRICGKDSHPLGFADTENWIEEFYGTVYLCADCVGDYARVFGFLSSDQYRDLSDKVAAQDEELSILRASLVNLENILDAYSRLRGPIDPPVSSGDDSSGTPEPVIQAASEGTQVVTDDGESGEGQVTKPISVERHDDVHGATADDLFAELGL